MVSFIINVLFSIINFMFAKWLEKNGYNLVSIIWLRGVVWDWQLYR